MIVVDYLQIEQIRLMLLLKRNYNVITAVLNDCRVFFPQSNPLLLLMVNSLGILILISYCWNGTVSLSLSSVSHTKPSQWIWSKENQNWGHSHPPDLRNKQTNQCANKVVILQNIYSFNLTHSTYSTSLSE